MTSVYPWKSAFVKYTHKKTHYYYNEADELKPALLFHHGFTDNGLCWDRLASKFVNNYQCYLLDARGHGKSSDPSADLRYTDLMEDVLDFCERLKLHDVVVIGHSMGGVLATMIATDDKEFIKGVVLEDPAFPTNLLNIANLKIRQVNSAIHKHRDIPKPKEHYIRKLHRMRPKWDEKDIEGCVLASQQFSLHYPLRNRRVLFSAPKWRDLVPKIIKPTLLLTSNRGLLTRKDGYVFQKLNSHVKWIHFEKKVGHSIRRDAFDKYYMVLNRFLNNLQKE